MNSWNLHMWTWVMAVFVLCGYFILFFETISNSLNFVLFIYLFIFSIFTRKVLQYMLWIP